MRLHSFYANLVLRSKSNLRICFDLDGTVLMQRAKTSGEKDGIFVYEIRLGPV